MYNINILYIFFMNFNDMFRFFHALLHLKMKWRRDIKKVYFFADSRRASFNEDIIYFLLE